MKKFLSIIFLFIGVATNLHAGSFALPSDLPTIEALIKLHKMIAKAEDKSIVQTGASKVEEDAIGDRTSKFEDVRKTLNSKLDNAYQWVYLGGMISHISLESYKTIKDYVDYTKFMTKNIKHKPQLGWYYLECNYNIKKRVDLLSESVVTLLAAQTNILKASMQERIMMAAEIQSEIEKIHDIITNSMWWARCITTPGVHYDFIWDILNSEMKDEIVKAAIARWDSEAKHYSINKDYL